MSSDDNDVTMHRDQFLKFLQVLSEEIRAECVWEAETTNTINHKKKKKTGKSPATNDSRNSLVGCWLYTLCHAIFHEQITVKF